MDKDDVVLEFGTHSRLCILLADIRSVREGGEDGCSINDGGYWVDEVYAAVMPKIQEARAKLDNGSLGQTEKRRVALRLDVLDARLAAVEKQIAQAQPVP